MAQLSLRNLSLLWLAYPFMALGQSNFLAPTQIASQFNLASSTSLALPTQTMDSNTTATWLKKTSGWQIASNGHITNSQLVNFTTDPFDSTNTSPVLSVTYPEGTFGNDGGTDFSNYFNDSSAGFGTMQISYQVGFPSDYQFVKGGKLPGLRGGLPVTGCDGGSNSNTCFSVRFMWRTNAQGEAYAYLQGPSDLCSEKDVICNSDGFGTSIDRGSFSFVAGTWNQVDMVVGLNNPVSSKNGYIAAYYNGALAINQTGLQIRSDSSVGSIQGMFFSTFFGGSDSSWAPSTNQTTYFKNIQMFASDSASKLVSSSASPRRSLLGLGSGVEQSSQWIIGTLLLIGGMWGAIFSWA